MKLRSAFFVFNLLFSLQVFSQVNYTANDSIEAFQGYFGYGANLGYYPPWTDDQLADIAAGNPFLNVDGVGVTTIRPGLFAHFLEGWGYDIRIPQFKHYENLGLLDNVAIAGFPSNDQRDQNHYCPQFQSQVFANLYDDIWDNGENGTPVNDNNHFALYMYKMVTRYKDYITFWEIWNEPDFDYSNTAWKPASYPESWWNKDPNPCDYALKAPVTYYVRMLRIAYQIIKTYDAESYVCIGGLGYPSFLDAVLRNTDNPKDGTVNDEFPLKGGAYFDVMDFHSYPHIDGSLRQWDNGINGFLHFRHSDIALKGVIKLKKEFQSTLEKHGYDNKIFPEKLYIITECNVPRKTFGDFLGSEEAQRNFLLKTMVEIQKHDVLQFHVYNLGESKEYDDADSEFHLMGLYKMLDGTQPFEQIKNNSGIAYKTISNILFGSSWDKKQSDQMQIPEGVNGAAFVDPYGYYTYVLWAETSKDRSEEASAIYTFPSYFNMDKVKIKEWDFSKNKKNITKQSQNIKLSATPIFITEYGTAKKSLSSPLPFNCYANPSTGLADIVFNLPKKSKVSLDVIDKSGKIIQQFYSDDLLKKGTYHQSFDTAHTLGVYICRLTINNKTYTNKIIQMK